MGCLHVFGGAGDGDVEVEVEGQDGARDEDDEDGKGRVLEISHLNLHAPELDAPPNVVHVVGGRRLEPHVLPIRALDVFEMVRLVEVEVLEVFGEDDDRVADEEMCKVRREQGVHAAGHEAGFGGRVGEEGRVVVFRAEACILGDVG